MPLIHANDIALAKGKTLSTSWDYCKQMQIVPVDSVPYDEILKG